MTEEQKKRKAERDKKYRENKKLKAERATPVDPNPVPPVIRLERHLPEPRKASLDATRPVPVPDYPQTDFDVLMRRMRRESAR